ncbi:MAG: sigma 54-interacting transcriptional regulator [Deltaproteobacteria bacterium]|jgi:DNA-binding NtrC family response regulator
MKKTLPVDARSRQIETIAIDVVAGPDAGHRFTAPRDEISIGTAPTNDLIISDDTVSRYHLQLERKPDGILLTDLDSTNGSEVNGIKVRCGLIRPDSKIRIGRTVLNVTDGARRELEVHGTGQLGRIHGRSEIIRTLMARILRAAASDVSVLIRGETGTGKELVAHELHVHSARRDQPFEVVDCASVLPTLLASELFGHERGAFTGADTQHIGAFERADGGTLFLDELGEFPTALQSALLGALERRRFHRVGGRTPIDVDVRVVCATNRDLRSEVNAGTFRQDLYYRIAVVSLWVPPLRERREDIELLAQHFLERSGHGSALLTPEILSSFQSYFWPGNVRELKNTLEAAVAMGEAPRLTSTDGGAPPAAAADLPNVTLGDASEQPFNEARMSTIEAFEIAYLNQLLGRHDDNVSRAAEAAGIHRSYLTKLLRRHKGRVRRPRRGSE